MSARNVKWGSEKFRSVYWVEDKNTGERKEFTGKDRREKSIEHRNLLRAEYSKPTLTEKQRKIQAMQNIRATGGDLADSVYAGITPPDFKTPKTPEALERQKNVLETSFQRLLDKKSDADIGTEEWTKKDQRDYDYYSIRLDDIRKVLGIYVPEDSKGDGDASPGEIKDKEPGYWEKAKKEKWIKARTNEIVLKENVNFYDAKKQAAEDWEKEHNKKDPARLFE